MDKLSRNLTKIDVLLDKLGLLHEGLKGKDEADLYELKLVRRYADELAVLLDQVLEDSPKGTTTTPPAVPQHSSPEMPKAAIEEKPNDVPPPREPQSNGNEEEVTSFSLQLDEEPEEIPVEEPSKAPVSKAPETPPAPLPPKEEARKEPVKKVDPLVAATVLEDEDNSDVNYRFREDKPQVLDRLKNKPISSLQREIGLNERFWFATELFDGDGEELQKLLKEIDTLPDLKQAELTLDVKGSVKYDWSGKEKVVQQFRALVQRRFQ